MSKKEYFSDTDERQPEEGESMQKKRADAAEEPTHRLNADIPKALYKRLRLRSVEEERSMKDIVIDSLNEYLSI